MHAIKKVPLLIIAALMVVVLSSCAGASAFGEQISRAFQGVPATWTSYDQSGRKIDEVHGTSFKVSRDTRFDTTNVGSDGKTTTVPGEVLLISLGSNHISHVGSSACLAQDGVVKIGDAKTFDFQNSDPGVPFINDLVEKVRNVMKGKSKVIVIRSQDGLPIAVYAGSQVEVFATDVPKSTWFRVDGQYLWCYRVDYTMVDTALL